MLNAPNELRCYKAKLKLLQACNLSGMGNWSPFENVTGIRYGRTTHSTLNGFVHDILTFSQFLEFVVLISSIRHYFIILFFCENKQITCFERVRMKRFNLCFKTYKISVVT